MKFQSIEKKQQGKYLTRYDITYEAVDGRKKVYEMISRDKNIETEEELINHPLDAVIIIAEDEAGERILINKEFRMATGRFIYNFPAGLIDPGETPEESAKRELWEETGLELLSIDDVIGVSYTGVGFTNETTVCVVGKAGGEFAPSTSVTEEIQAGWYTKEEIRSMLKTEPFAARTQAYCYLWSRE